MTAMEQPPSAVSVGMVQQCSHAALPCAIAACCQAPRYLVDLLKDEHASIAAAAEAALDVAASAGPPWAAQVRARRDAVRERRGNFGQCWVPGVPGLWPC